MNNVNPKDMWWTISKLKPEDWDFRKDKLPDEDWPSCHQYEYRREDAKFRQTVLDSRKRYRDFDKKWPWPSPKSIADALFEPHPALAYTVNPKWPDTPFRLLPRPAKEKQRPDDSFPPSPEFHAIIQWPIERLVRERFGKEDFPGELKGKDFAGTPISTLWCHSEQSDLVAFQIPWHWPDAVLVNGFAQWLKGYRPQGKKGDSRPIVKQTKKPTGAAANPRQMLADLKALGAYRLLLCYNGNRHKARGHSGVETILGKDFVTSDSAWTDAKKRAQQMIGLVSEMNQPSIQLERIAGKSPKDFASTQNRVEAK